MAPNLNLGIGEFFTDRPLVGRVCRAIALDSGVSFIEAVDRLHAGADRAISAGDRTLRRALKWTGGDVEYITETIQLLDRRDQVVDSTYQRALEPITLEQTDRHGRVLLDQSAAAIPPKRVPSGRAGERLETDIGHVLGDPMEFERRLARVRRVEPNRWAGDEGRATFRDYDRQHAEQGYDFVRMAERPAELTAARAQADQLGAQLDAAIAAAGKERAKLKAFHDQIGKLQGPAGARDTAREQLEPQLRATNAPVVRLLDQLASGEPSGAATADVPTWEQVQDRMRALDRPQHEFTKTMREMERGEPTPIAPAPQAPPGVHRGSHDLDRRVRERLTELGAKPSDYTKVYEQLLQEEAS